MQKNCDFRGCLGTTNAWSPDTVLEFSSTQKLNIQFQWLPYPESKLVEEKAATKLQAAWKGKQVRTQLAATKHKQRSLIGRFGLKSEDGRYYFLAFYQEDSGIAVALHLTDDPSQPMYEEVDYQIVSPGIDIEDLKARIKVSTAGKLIL